ncbi:MAG: Zn-dependent exopeptidase M28 [candidate division WS1 bacterium]|jgi:acetylornithine deacetylase/succinyl-diaminopimelate desuccinylase-like protein|nr:Zn-dependent exopeptidase M28 [candidate division WS1 bacterium]
MPTFRASAENVDRHLQVLCRDIGNRLGATDAERRAAQYVAEQMEAVGLRNVTMETFPFHVWGYSEAWVDVLADEGPAIRCIPIANSRPTPEAGVEAEVVYVDSATAADLAMNEVEGKLLLIWGLSGDAEQMEMLEHSGAAGLLWVDDRFPVDWPVSAGTPYAWRDIITLPQVTMPYWEALKLAKMTAPHVRLTSNAWSEAGESVNVWGDLPGAGDEMVHMTAHIDSVIVGTGAEDDGSGVAAMLEAARMLADLGECPERTIRFCGFGAEEQLSEGSRVYVERHPEEADRTRLVVNLDSVAAITGRNQLIVVGPEGLVEACTRMTTPGHRPLREPLGEAAGTLTERAPVTTRGGDTHRPEEAGPGATHSVTAGTPSRDRASIARGSEFGRPQEVGHAPRVERTGRVVLSGEVMEHVTPFSDMFPFNVRGCPSVFLHRMNQAGTRYFHHSDLDDLQSVSTEVIATHANAAAHLAHLTAFTGPPFEREIPEAQMREVEDMAERYLG